MREEQELEECNICEVGIEYYYEIKLPSQKIIICDSCLSESFDFVWKMLSIEQKGFFLQKLEDFSQKHLEEN